MASPRPQLLRWQVVRTWARLIREAEALWRVDAREMHRLAAHELAELLVEVPPGLRPRVNRWLVRLGGRTRLHEEAQRGSRRPQKNRPLQGRLRRSDHG